MASFGSNIKNGSTFTRHAWALCVLSVGCGSDATSSNGGASGGGSGAGAQSGATAGGSAGASGSGGSGGNAVAGGGGTSSVAGTSSTAGAAGMAGSGGSGGALACPAMGTQSDPGTTGDGKAQLDPPYVAAPETLSHLNGAPRGKINGVEVGGAMPTPFVYAKKTAYPGVPGGDQMLKYEYWIYVPAQYEPGCAAALAVFQDGLHFVGIDDANLNTPTVLDNLIANGDIPVTIALFINPGEPGTGHYDGHETPIRSAQYDKNNDTYVNFLVDEFLPANVLNAYSIVTDPDGWEIGGHSSGGVAAFMAGWYRPEKFHKLLTLDASFPNTQPNNGVALLDAINQGAMKPLRTYLMSGPNDLGGWYPANTQAAMELGAKGYHYQYKVEQSMHYPPLAAVADYANAMRWMWRGYKL